MSCFFLESFFLLSSGVQQQRDLGFDRWNLCRERKDGWISVIAVGGGSKMNQRSAAICFVPLQTRLCP
jgi:hypothetical protein